MLSQRSPVLTAAMRLVILIAHEGRRLAGQRETPAAPEL
jgi:hypothetical protein